MKIEKENRLINIQALFEHADNCYEPIRAEIEKNWEQYNGGKEIELVGGGTDTVAYVRNITFELTESQVSTFIPPAQVRPMMYSKTNHERAKIIEHFLNTYLDKISFEKINDLDERISRIAGASVFLVEWDDSITTHNTQGGYRITVLDPRYIVPQPAIYEVQDMEYFFYKFNDTYENLERRYGVDFEDIQGTNEDEATSDDTATVIVCLYRDESDKICKFTFCDNTVLEDIEDYLGRKAKKCKICGKYKSDCTCKEPKYVDTSLDEEEITKEYNYFNGLVRITPDSHEFKDGQPQYQESEQPQYDESGNILFEVMADGTPMPRMQTVQAPKTIRTKVPFYRPSLFPIVIHKNISLPNKLLGQSDCDIIRDQQQTINKLESRINEKLINSGVAITKGEDTRFELSSDIFKKGIEVKTAEEAAKIKVIDFAVSTQQDEKRSENIYQHAKKIIGISDSYQGQEDSTAQSGYAKQIQVQQSEGRQQSKRVMKNAAYAELFEVMFQQALAYSDEPRPISYNDPLQGYRNEEFVKYMFLERDKVGEWYYNDEFVFAVSQSADYEKNRIAMWQETKNNFMGGAFGNPQEIETLIYYWRIMDELHYPMAGRIAEMFEQKLQRLQQQANLQAQQAISQARQQTANMPQIQEPQEVVK